VEEVLGTPHKPDEVMAALPADPREMFVPEFLEALDGKGRHWLLDAIAQNNVDGWTPKAPVRLYYGSADLDVPPREASLGAERFRARGADVVAVDVGPVGHEPTLLLAAPMMLDWLEALDAEG
jgi:hypothetical protein